MRLCVCVCGRACVCVCCFCQFRLYYLVCNLILLVHSLESVNCLVCKQQHNISDFESDINNWPILASAKALVLAFLQTEIFQILHGDTFFEITC